MFWWVVGGILFVGLWTWLIREFVRAPIHDEDDWNPPIK